ncbi:MAG TPA: LysR substrate-binding domain-containing protein [Stellaceae bacterium]|jgi:DNA-binding transcriptional LysR family regulator|nr:LysR substrate-binding domain-containing protein [Stellaceae bacterium]
MRSLRSFVTIVETGSVTEAARRMGRTQPAITLQIRRLEEQLGKYLFAPAQRRPQLTDEGEVLLGYARAMLRMHDEVWQRIETRRIEGRVVLGTPDLYAAYLLPQILANFRAVYPNVEVDVRCALSRTLMDALDAKEIDIALVTDMPGIRAGEFVRKEPLVWVSGQHHNAHNENPVPLALLPPGNIYRDAALEALNRIGRPWRLVCISESIGGLQAAVFSGFAVSVVAKSALVPGMRVIGRPESFPDLPEVGVIMHRSPSRSSEAVDCLADFVVASLLRGNEQGAASLAS